MAEVLQTTPTVVRTAERGLTVGGTRLTLYDIWDCLNGGWSEEETRETFRLTEQQMADVLAYIEEHRDEFLAEYEQGLKEAEETRRCWEERNRERLAEIAARPRDPAKAELWAKLDAWKARLERS